MNCSFDIAYILTENIRNNPLHFEILEPECVWMLQIYKP